MNDCGCTSCLFCIHDLYIGIINRISKLFTVNIDPFKYADETINFHGSKEYGSYSIVLSNNEKNRRIVHWFYRTFSAPTLTDWNYCLRLFNLETVPEHTLQLYDQNYFITNKFIHIHKISDKHITYTYENKDTNIKNTVSVPLGYASLVPEKFLFNLKLYYTDEKRQNN